MAMKNNLILRPAKMADAELLLSWRNDPDTRAASHNHDPVTWPEHIGWLAISLAKPGRSISICELDGVPVGTVRTDYDLNNDSVQLSYTVAPEHRCKGIGGRIVDAIVKMNKGRHVTGEIFAGNIAARKIAERNGINFQVIE